MLSSLRIAITVLSTAALCIAAGPYASTDKGSDSIGPTTYTLPGNNTFTEDVTLLPGTETFFTVSTTSGTIFRGHLNSSSVTPWVNGSAHGMAMGVGIHAYDEKLYIAGGLSGTMFVFSAVTGELINRFSNGLNGSFLNDLAIDPVTGDVFITDTYLPYLWSVEGSQVGAENAVDQQLTNFADLSPTIDFQPGEFNGNGIVITPEREYVVMADSNDYKLYRVTRATKEVVQLDLGDAFLGGADGLVYDGKHLFAVNGYHDAPGSDFISVVELSAPYTKGTIVGNVTNPLLYKAAGVDFVDGGKEFIAANYQGEVEDPVLPFTIVRIPVEW